MLQTTKSAKLKRMIKLDRSLQMRLEWLKFSKNDGFRKKRFLQTTLDFTDIGTAVKSRIIGCCLIMSRHETARQTDSS